VLAGKSAAFKDIVDGKQRLSAIIGFVEGEFEDLHGNKWEDLSRDAQYKFFDFSDPMGKGWPELGLPEEVGGCLDYSDHTSLEWEDGAFVWRSHDWLLKETGERFSDIEAQESQLYHEKSRLGYQEATAEEIAAVEAALVEHQTRYAEEPDENPSLWERLTDHEIRFKNESGKLVLVSETKSQFQQDKEARYEKGKADSLEQRKAWMNACPVFQHLVLMVGGDAISRQVGFKYPSMVDRWKGEPNPAFFQVRAEAYDGENPQNRTSTIVWGVLSGDLKVELWVRGEGNAAQPEFPRTVEGLHAAWDAAQQHLIHEHLD